MKCGVFLDCPALSEPGHEDTEGNAGGVGGTKCTIEHEVTFGIHTFGDLGE